MTSSMDHPNYRMTIFAVLLDPLNIYICIYVGNPAQLFLLALLQLDRQLCQTQREQKAVYIEDESPPNLDFSDML